MQLITKTNYTNKATPHKLTFTACNHHCLYYWILLSAPRGEMQIQGAAHTHCQANLFILVGQAIVVIEVKPPSCFPVTEQILLQTEKHTEVAFTADQPNWVFGGLQVTANLEGKYKIAERHWGWAGRNNSLWKTYNLEDHLFILGYKH